MEHENPFKMNEQETNRRAGSAFRRSNNSRTNIHMPQALTQQPLEPKRSSSTFAPMRRNGRNMRQSNPYSSNVRVRHRPGSPIHRVYGAGGLSNNMTVGPEVIHHVSKKLDGNTLEIEIDQTINLNSVDQNKSHRSNGSDKTVPKSPLSGSAYPSDSPSQYNIVHKIDISTD